MEVKEHGLTHPASFYWDRTITATNMIWFDVKRDTLALPSEEFADKSMVALRGTRALTKRDVMDCWSHEKVPDIRIEGVMRPLTSRVRELEDEVLDWQGGW